MKQNLILADQLLNYVWETCAEGPILYSKFYMTDALIGATLIQKNTKECFETYVYLEKPSYFKGAIDLKINNLWVTTYYGIDNLDFSNFSVSNSERFNRLSVQWQKHGFFSHSEIEKLISSLPKNEKKTDFYLMGNSSDPDELAYLSIDILLSSHHDDEGIDSLIRTFSLDYEGDLFEYRAFGIRDKLDNDIHQNILPRFA